MALARRRADEEEAETREDEAFAEVHALRQDRAHSGRVAQELELRELAVEHRRAFVRFLGDMEKASFIAQARGMREGRRFLETEVKADIHMLGYGPNQVVNWYIRLHLQSPFYVARLLDAGEVGKESRARFGAYVEENYLRPGLERLWRQPSKNQPGPIVA